MSYCSHFLSFFLLAHKHHDSIAGSPQKSREGRDAISLYQGCAVEETRYSRRCFFIFEINVLFKKKKLMWKKKSRQAVSLGFGQHFYTVSSLTQLQSPILLVRGGKLSLDKVYMNILHAFFSAINIANCGAIEPMVTIVMQWMTLKLLSSYSCAENLHISMQKTVTDSSAFDIGSVFWVSHYLQDTDHSPSLPLIHFSLQNCWLGWQWALLILKYHIVWSSPHCTAHWTNHHSYRHFKLDPSHFCEG